MVVDQGNDNSRYINEIKRVIIPISEIISSKSFRFDASVYCTQGRSSRLLLEKSRLNITSLSPNQGLVSDCLYPNRFKRVYAEREHGFEFFLPSQINEINPKADKYISSKTEVNLEELKVQRGSLLLTRSGTVGNITYVSETLNHKIFSDDVIRMYFDNPINAGYTYAFLKSKIGQAILTTNNYGAVIQHVEPSHLSDIKIPDPKIELKEAIYKLISESFRLRDESNKIIEEAQNKLITELQLPTIVELQAKVFKGDLGVKTWVKPAIRLSGRFDCSYHYPLVDAIYNELIPRADKLISLGDKAISEKIVLAGIFKRTYVAEGQGIPFLGGRDILQLEPKTEKYLSRKVHKKLIDTTLRVEKNMILITDRGTIGNVVIAPKHFEGCAVSQNVIKLKPINDDIAGYLYAFLSTEYGKELIKRETYGSVVDMIDNHSVASVMIPVLKNKAVQKHISAQVLLANDYRYKAYQLEKKAISLINTDVLPGYYM